MRLTPHRPAGEGKQTGTPPGCPEGPRIVPQPRSFSLPSLDNGDALLIHLKAALRNGRADEAAALKGALLAHHAAHLEADGGGIVRSLATGGDMGAYVAMQDFLRARPALMKKLVSLLIDRAQEDGKAGFTVMMGAALTAVPETAEELTGRFGEMAGLAIGVEEIMAAFARQSYTAASHFARYAGFWCHGALARAVPEGCVKDVYRAVREQLLREALLAEVAGRQPRPGLYAETARLAYAAARVFGTFENLNAALARQPCGSLTDSLGRLFPAADLELVMETPDTVGLRRYALALRLSDRGDSRSGPASASRSNPPPILKNFISNRTATKKRFGSAPSLK